MHLKKNSYSHLYKSSSSAGLEREGGKAGESQSSNFCEASFFRRIKRSTDKVVFAFWTALTL